VLKTLEGEYIVARKEATFSLKMKAREINSDRQFVSSVLVIRINRVSVQFNIIIPYQVFLGEL
jgi:hypothetical protein